MASSSDLAPVVVHATRRAEPTIDPMPTIDTNATRHLSAGAYLDEEFCRSALREVYYQPKRIVAPSYGFDAVTVLGHCLRARRALVVRDGLLVAVLLLASWVSVFGLVAILVLLLAVHALVTAVVVARDAVKYLGNPMHIDRDPLPDDDMTSRDRRRKPGSGHRHQPVRPRTFRRLWLENVLAQIFARMIGVTLTYAVFAIVALGVAFLSALMWDGNPLGPPWSGSASLVAIGCLAVVAFLAPAATRAWSQLQLRKLVPDRPTVRPVITPRLIEIDEQTGGNTVVYTGYKPFVGSGSVLRRWDLAQRLVRPDTGPGGPGASAAEALREFPTPPFTAREISAYVRDYIDELAKDPVPERRLPALRVTDRVFVAGTEIADLRPHTSDLRMAEIIRNPTAPQRHYVVCQVVSWRGELVTTVYVHFAVQGKALYVELYVTGLLPCDERFRVVDQVGGTGLKGVVAGACRAAAAAPLHVAAAPTALARAFADQLTIAFAGRSGRSRVRRGYDYGATVGLRELGESAAARDHMQTQDITKYGRIIERLVLAAILDFLERRGVDVNEYRQRSLTILNAGAVAMAGGTVNVGGDAVGMQINDAQGAN